MQDLQRPERARDLLVRRRTACSRAVGRLRRRARLELRARRHVRRPGRLPQATRPAPCASRAPATAPRSATSTCATARDAAGRPGHDLRPVQLRHDDEHLRDQLPLEHRLRRGILCVNGSCGPKPNGAVVREGRRVRVRLLRRRRLLQRRLQGRVRHLQPGRAASEPAGPSTPARIDPHGVCAVQTRRDLRHDRRLRRHRRLRAVRGRDRLPPPVVQRRSPQHRRHLQRARHLPAAGDPELRPLPVRATAPASTAAPSDADCVAGHACRQRELRPEAERATLHGGRRVREQLLRRRRLLRSAPAPAPAGAARCRRRSGTLHAGRGRRRRSAQQSASTQARVDLRHRRHVRRRGRLPQVPAGHRLRRRALREQRLHARVDLQRHRAPASRPTRSPASRSPATARSCFGSCSDRRELLAGQRLHRQLVRPEAERGLLLGRGRVRVEHLRPGRLLRDRLHERLPVVRALRARWAPAPTSPANSPDPAADLRRQAAATCGTNGKCAAGACQKLRAGHAVRGATCPAARHHADARVRLRRRRRLRHAGRDLLLPVPLRRRRLQVDLHRRRRLRGRPRLRRRLVRPQAARRELRRPRRVQERDLHPGRLLRDRLHGAAACPARWPAAPGPAADRRRTATDPKGQCTAEGAGELRHAPASATAMAPASSTRPAPSARRRPARPAATTATLARTCDGAGVCRAGDDAVVRPVRVQRHDLHLRLRRRRRLRAGQRLQRGRLRPEAPRPALRRGQRMRQRQLRRRRLLLGRAAAAPAGRATSPAWRAAATRSRPTTWSRTAAAPPTRPAASTARATATAPAATPRSATAAAPPRAAARRSRRSATATAAAAASSRRRAARPFVCGATACRTTCARRRRLRRRVHLPVGLLHQPQGRTAPPAWRDRVPQRQLHGRRLLHGRQLRQLPLLRDRRASRAPASPWPPAPTPPATAPTCRRRAAAPPAAATGPASARPTRRGRPARRPPARRRR